MRLDIRNRDQNVPITFKQLWLKEQYEKIRMVPELADMDANEIKKLLLEKYENRHISTGRLYNLRSGEKIAMTQEGFINEYLNKPYILTGYSCFFRNQNDVVNISSAALKNLGDLRKFYKKKMEAAEHGSNEYVYYRILQLTYKVLMNSYYGILGEKNSIFYHPYIQNSITTSGQDLVTTLIISMEAFLRNNVPFEDTDDILTFINSIRTEDRSFNILDYLDAQVTDQQLLDHFLESSRYPETIDQSILSSVISSLDLETKNRCFYKCHLLDLIKNNSYFRNKLSHILQYEYAEQPAPEIVNDVQEFRDRVIDFTFNNMLFEDRYLRAMKHKRKAITVIDTDSIFANVNPHVEEITEFLQLDRSNKVQQGSIVNLLINITTEVLRQILWTLTTNMGLVNSAKPIIAVKQEFLYSKLMITNNKKNYCRLITAELGHILDHPVLDVKGLPALKKTSVPKSLRRQFTKIVREDILEPEKINLKEVLNKFDQIGEDIHNSLQARSAEYLLPKNLEIIESYKSPDTIEAVRAALIWNALEPENPIIPPEKINLLKLNCFEETDPRLQELKETYPDKYNAIMKAVFNYGVSNPKIDISRFGLSCIAIPKGVETIPEYLIPFIDYTTMVNNNVSTGYILLESLGIYVTDVKTTKYKSNIISI